MTFEIVKENENYILRTSNLEFEVHHISKNQEAYRGYKITYEFVDRESDKIELAKIRDNYIFKMVINDIERNFDSVIFALNYGNTFEFKVEI